MQPDQSYPSHRRYHPLFHFFAIPVLSINILVHIWWLVRRPALVNAWALVVALAFLTTCYLARAYALSVQNRVIRLEERLRLQTLLPDDLRPRISEIRTGQLIGLRFCSDEELPDVARAVLAGELKTSDEIKRRVQNWRADHHRV
jgi:hypothetical protein